MESLFGLVGKDFTLTVSDSNAGRSIMLFKDDEDKSRDLGKFVTMFYCGEPGDTVNFAEFIQKNARLYSIRNDLELSPSSAASFVRRQLAESLRSRNAYHVSLLIAGYDAASGPELYWLDYLGTLAKTKFSAHGYAGYFILSTLDRHYRPDMTLPEALELVQMCLKELRIRFMINQSKFTVKVVDASGIRKLDISLPPADAAASVTVVPRPASPTTMA